MSWKTSTKRFARAGLPLVAFCHAVLAVKARASAYGLVSVSLTRRLSVTAVILFNFPRPYANRFVLFSTYPKSGDIAL